MSNIKLDIANHETSGTSNNLSPYNDPRFDRSPAEKAADTFYFFKMLSAQQGGRHTMKLQASPNG